MKTFKQFITESQEVLNKISSSWERKHPGLKLRASIGHFGNINIHKIEVPKELRGQGIGSRIMKGLSNYADKIRKRTTLTPEPEPGYKGKLEKFYKRFGYKPNTGRNRDFGVSDSRIREPKN